MSPSMWGSWVALAIVQVALGGLSLRVSYGPQARVVSPAPQTCQLIASPTAQRPPAITLMEMAPSHPVVLATGKDAASQPRPLPSGSRGLPPP